MCCVVQPGSLPRSFRRAFTSAAVLWALLLPFAAFAASRPPDSSISHLSAVVPYAIGAVVCHQQAARSFRPWSRQLPVCARCTGIYVGAALAAILAVMAPPKRRPPYETSTRAGARTIVLLAALPTIATLAYEWSTGATPSNLVRAFAGFPLGAAVAAVILATAGDQVN